MPSQQRRPPAKANPAPPGAGSDRPGPSTDVATTGKGTLTSFIQTYEGDFSRVMPAHVNVQAFVGLAAAYVRRDPKLREAAQANPAALILALRECAALGHTPVPKIFALVPFRVSADLQRKRAAGWNITGIETYHGVIERMYRAGGVQSVHCELVRRTDDFEWDAINQRVTRHKYDPFASDEERGELAGVYAWARLFTGGLSQVVWMNRGEVMKHRAASRSGDAFWGGVWEPSMWRKTGLHGLETYVPTSAEYRWTVALSGSAAASGFSGIPDVPVLESNYGPSPDDVIEAELVDEPGPSAARTQRPAPRATEPSRGAAPARSAPPRSQQVGQCGYETSCPHCRCLARAGHEGDHDVHCGQPTRHQGDERPEDEDETGGADPDNDPVDDTGNPFDRAKSPEDWAEWERQEAADGQATPGGGQ